MDVLPPPPRKISTPSSTPTTSRKIRGKSIKDKRKNGKMGSGRAIPIKEGYLYKKSNKTIHKEWNKKYVTVCDNGTLSYYSSFHDYMEDGHGRDIFLQYTTVKVRGMHPCGTKSGESTPEHLSGIMNGFNLANQGLAPILNTVTSNFGTQNIRKSLRRRKSSGNKTEECEDSERYDFSIVSLDNKQWHFEADNHAERDEWITAIEKQTLSSLQRNESNKRQDKPETPINTQIITTIKNQVPGNLNCVDCDRPNPEWASINLGILMCIECSGIHRNLGSHISKVRSLDLDEWSPGPLSVMMGLGNATGNSIWEARPSQGKPKPDSSREDKERWIRTKYENKEFIVH
ncbi:unnamed protein product, partial [Meganyctiphanes norvegica]